MKVLVKKQDLKQMLELLGDGKLQSKTQVPNSSSLSNVEQRLNLLRRKHVSRGKGCRDSSPRSWIPALQSIPE
ncbi:hypothetical protein LINGRAHAP2_LOCUS4194 [Linum grandiflorum]